MGCKLYASVGTAQALEKDGTYAEVVGKLTQCDDINRLIRSGSVKIIINTPTKGRDSRSDGFKIRRMAVEQGATCFTSLDTAAAFVRALKLGKTDKELSLCSLKEVERINATE